LARALLFYNRQIAENTADTLMRLCEKRTKGKLPPGGGVPPFSGEPIFRDENRSQGPNRGLCKAAVFIEGDAGAKEA